MKVELLRLTEDATNFIGDCAGICYNAPRTPEANRKRAISCTTKGHLATLRFAHAVFHVSGISRACSHQFVRSKHLDFLQQSQRYVNQSCNGVVFPSTSIGAEFATAYANAMQSYELLLKQGVKKEDARFVLPEGMMTELVVVGNLQAWLDFITLRDCKEAQWEIRSVAQEINRQLNNKLPELFPYVTRSCHCSS